jgi:hypothetical protein
LILGRPSPHRAGSRAAAAAMERPLAPARVGKPTVVRPPTGEERVFRDRPNRETGAAQPASRWPDGGDIPRFAVTFSPAPVMRASWSYARPPGRDVGRESPSSYIEIQSERACHRVVTCLYPPLARKRDRDHGAGTTRLLLFSAGFVRFRAPIDSVMDPGGWLRRPSDPFLSLRHGSGPTEGSENETIDTGVMLQ